MAKKGLKGLKIYKMNIRRFLERQAISKGFTITDTPQNSREVCFKVTHDHYSDGTFKCHWKIHSSHLFFNLQRKDSIDFIAHLNSCLDYLKQDW